ncbi:hypothetical protein ACFXA3_02830 [Streptomyces sp. NPDC059456]|uniref:hypothetical protein n=1 Tax=Streptomyces sp. NPDC059456 TaxID=3346838 RepID=UPI0036CDDB32
MQAIRAKRLFAVSAIGVLMAGGAALGAAGAASAAVPTHPVTSVTTVTHGGGWDDDDGGYGYGGGYDDDWGGGYGDC